MKQLDFPGIQSDYTVYINQGLLADAQLWRAALAGCDSKAMLVADQVVSQHYLEPIVRLLSDQLGLDVHIHLLHAGEQSKSLDNAASLWNILDANKFRRTSTLVAFGGGVIGDLSCFVASTYHRGMNLIQVPTTLLSMLDSAVGGKSAVNLGSTKNLIGSFYDSKAVLIDPACLATLPATLIASGLGEALKYAVLDTTDFVSWTQRIPLIEDFHKDPQKVVSLIEDCLKIKRRHITGDARDMGGSRALLNLGHTFAHALESLSNYSDWDHGEAVTAGLVLAMRLARSLGRVGDTEVANIEQMAERLYLRTRPPRFAVKDWVEAFLHDKKAAQTEVEFILPHSERLPERVPVKTDSPELLELLEVHHSG